MRRPFRKRKTQQYIRYTQPNQEPPEHVAGKLRVRELLLRIGYILLTNAPKHEFAMPTTTNIFNVSKDYTIDLLMYNHKVSRVIAVEVHGGYHSKDKKAIADTRWKEEAEREWLLNNDKVYCDGETYPYLSWRFRAFETDDLVGKYALSDIEVYRALV